MFQPDELKALLNQLRKHWFTQAILISKHVLKNTEDFPQHICLQDLQRLLAEDIDR